MRAHRLHVLRLPASKAAIVVCWLAAPDPLLRRRPTENLQGRAQAPGLRFSAGSQGFRPRRHPSRLTSRSSRPRVVASAMCFTLRSHMSAAPPQGGLTPALCGTSFIRGLSVNSRFFRNSTRNCCIPRGISPSEFRQGSLVLRQRLCARPSGKTALLMRIGSES